MHPYVNIAVNAAREAGRVITQNMDKIDKIAVSEKQRNDFVSEVDIRAEETIIHTIQKAYPKHGILAEESGVHEASSDTVWIIDPLDGTRNYLQGIPHFAVSIAVKEKGKIEHGVIFDPLRQEIFTASRGAGAYLNQRRIRVNAKDRLSKAILGTGFPFRQKSIIKTYLALFEGLFLESGGMRRAGSATLDLAYVAAGRLDGFWEFGLKPWDVAAGALLIREAGGLVSDFAGNDNILDAENIIAGSPKIFKAMHQVMRPLLNN